MRGSASPGSRDHSPKSRKTRETAAIHRLASACLPQGQHSRAIRCIGHLHHRAGEAPETWASRLIASADRPVAWPGLLREALHHLLSTPTKPRPLLFRLLVDAAMHLFALDLLESLVHDGQVAAAMRAFLRGYAARRPAGVRHVLEQQVANGVSRARAPEHPPAALHLAPLGLGETEPSLPPGISVIVVLHGRPFLLHRLLASIGLLGGAAPIEVLVLVNGETAADEGAMAALLGTAVPLTVLRTAEAIPVGVARNRLVEAARYETILSLDSDMVVLQPVEALVPAAGTSLTAPWSQVWNVGYLGVRDLTHVRLVKFMDGGDLHADGLRTLRNRTQAHLDARTLAETTRTGQILLGNRMSGGASLFPRRIFRELGGFSEEFDIGWEDVEFSLRLAASGRLIHNPLAVGLYHGHVLPFTSADLEVEQRRFDPARNDAGLAVLARSGFVPGASLEMERSRSGDVGAFRRSGFKLDLLRDLDLPMMDGLGPEPIVGWVAGTSELADGDLRNALAAAPPVWRNVVLSACEVASLPRLACNLLGVDAVVLGAEAARFLAGRSEPFAGCFAALNERFAPKIVVLGPLGAAAGALRRLFPRARVEELPELNTNELALSLIKATAARRRRRST